MMIEVPSLIFSGVDAGVDHPFYLQYSTAPNQNPAISDPGVVPVSSNATADASTYVIEADCSLIFLPQ